MLAPVSLGEVFDRRRLALFAPLARWVLALVDPLAKGLGLVARRQGRPDGKVADREPTFGPGAPIVDEEGSGALRVAARRREETRKPNPLISLSHTVSAPLAGAFAVLTARSSILIGMEGLSSASRQRHFLPRASTICRRYPSAAIARRCFPSDFFACLGVLVSYQGPRGDAGTGLKIPRPQGRAGSTPAVRTNTSSHWLSFNSLRDIKGLKSAHRYNGRCKWLAYG